MDTHDKIMNDDRYLSPWQRKPWLWSKRFLLRHPDWISFTKMLWIPIPRRLAKYLWNRKFKKAEEKTRQLRAAGLVYDPDKHN